MKNITKLTLAMLMGFNIAIVTEAQAKSGKNGAAIGLVVGAIAGAVIGDGDPAAIAIGAIGGAVVGYDIGKSIENPQDRERYRHAERSCYTNPNYPGIHAWSGNTVSGHTHMVRTETRIIQQQTTLCSVYRSEIQFYGSNRIERSESVACQTTVNTWTVVESRRL